MNIKKLKLADLTPSPYNPRVELTPDMQEYQNIQDSIETYGLVEPLVVNDVNMHVVGGNQRFGILQSMGIEEAECVVIHEEDDMREKAICLALNKVKGTWDVDKLEDLFETGELYEFPTGFTQDDFQTDSQDGTEDDSDVEAEYESSNIIAKIGTYKVELTAEEYNGMLADIRRKGFFDRESICKELERRLFGNDSSSTD